MDGSADGSQDGQRRRRKNKKSRWAGTDNDKTFIPGMPTILPAGMTPDQQQAYLGKAHTKSIDYQNNFSCIDITRNDDSTENGQHCRSRELIFNFFYSFLFSREKSCRLFAHC